MRFSIAWLLLVGAQAVGTFAPYRLSFKSLQDDAAATTGSKADDHEALVEALSKVGMVSIRDIPGYASLRESTLSALFECAKLSEASVDHTFPDGTVRSTLATRTIPGPGGAQPIRGAQEDCREFSESSDQLRSVVDQVVRSFGVKVASLLEDGHVPKNAPLLETPSGFEFSSFADVVENGEHLEHFHSYVGPSGSLLRSKDDKTIDFHVDQGLFIAFTPPHGDESSRGSFFIQLQDGSQPEVDLEDSDLVIMLGDGINQFVNPHQRKHGRHLKLRATPHAMRTTASTAARSWHGRMVLPPTDAIHQDSGETYGRFRQLMIDASLDNNEGDNQDDMLAIGCSGDAVARQLEEATCAEGSSYCWHRCMIHADHNVSQTLCDSLGVQLQCINPRDQVSDGDSHGDYFPACSDSVEVATDYPTIPGYPRDPEVCDEEAWETFSDTAGYEFSFDNLGDNQGNRGFWEGAANNTKGQGKVAKFMWNVKDNMIDGKLVFNGGFGYLALGFMNPGGDKNGMNGASVIMAIPGGNYSARFGLDLDLDESVQEYVITSSGSAFRHWSDPLPDRDTSSYQVTTEGECFTALTFTTDNINDIKFNPDGIDDLIWSGNLKDRFCGSHGRGQDGRGDRDRFVVEWKTGKAWFPNPVEVVEIPAKPEEEKEEDTGIADIAEGLQSSAYSLSPARAGIFAILAVALLG